MLSPFFAWFLSRAKIRSCLRIRLAPSISLVLAISTSSVTGLDLRSDRCMDGWGAGRNRSSLWRRRAAAFSIREIGAGERTTAPVVALEGGEASSGARFNRSED